MTKSNRVLIQVTEEELQEQAQDYLGRELTAKEIDGVQQSLGERQAAAISEVINDLQ